MKGKHEKRKIGKENEGRKNKNWKNREESERGNGWEKGRKKNKGREGG